VIAGAVNGLDKKFFPSYQSGQEELPIGLLERLVEKEEELEQREAMIQTLLSHSKD
jgi:hypothetical protein